MRRYQDVTGSRSILAEIISSVTGAGAGMICDIGLLPLRGAFETRRSRPIDPSTSRAIIETLSTSRAGAIKMPVPARPPA
jgi:hypothetical protein